MSAAFKHHGDEVLADVVQVAFDGGDDGLVLGLGPVRDEQRLENRRGRSFMARAATSISGTKISLFL